MDSSDSSDGIPSKKVKATGLFDKCIIHQPTSPGFNFIIIIQLTDADLRIEKICHVCKLRQSQPVGSSTRMDDICQQIPDTIETDHGYHRDCYQKFAKNLNRLAQQPQQGIETCE